MLKHHNAPFMFTKITITVCNTV